VNENNGINPLSPAIKRHLDNLDSLNPRQRSHAATELGKQADPRVVPPLIKVLHEDINTYVRAAVAESLGYLNDERAIFPLMDALQDTSSFVRRAAALSLGRMHAKEAQVVLLRALEDTNIYVRRAAITAIGKLGIPDLGQVLLPLLETDDRRVQRNVITALHRLEMREAIPSMIALLEEYLYAPCPQELPVVKALVVALGKLQASEALPVLTRVMRGYVGTRSIAAKTLGELGDPSAGPALVEVLRGRSTGLLVAALASIRQLDYREALPQVRPFLFSSDPRLRREATMTVAQLADQESIPVLLQMVQNDPSPLARPAVVEALGYVDDARVLPQLLPLVDDMNAYVRAALIPTLVTLNNGSPRVRVALETLAQDKVRHVAAAAQRALEQFEGEPVVIAGDVGMEEEHSSWLPRWLTR